MTPPTKPQFSDSLKAAKLLYGTGPYTPAKIRNTALAEYNEALKVYAEALATAFESPKTAETTTIGASEMLAGAEPAVVEAAAVEVTIRKTRVKREAKPPVPSVGAEPEQPQQEQPASESSVDSNQPSP